MNIINGIIIIKKRTFYHEKKKNCQDCLATDEVRKKGAYFDKLKFVLISQHDFPRYDC